VATFLHFFLTLFVFDLRDNNCQTHHVTLTLTFDLETAAHYSRGVGNRCTNFGISIIKSNEIDRFAMAPHYQSSGAPNTIWH